MLSSNSTFVLRAEYLCVCCGSDLEFRTDHNITGFFPAKRQNNPRNSTTRFRRSTIVYNASVTEACLRPARPCAHAHLNSALLTEAGTSLRTCSLEQRNFQSLPPAGLNLKISRKRDCAGWHRPADFILICVSRFVQCLQAMRGLCRGLTVSTLRAPSTGAGNYGAWTINRYVKNWYR